jgi:SNF2 family DNA or RNA helicase
VLALHAAWRSGSGLALWAEDATIPRPVPSARSGGRPRGAVPAHPFAAAHKALLDALEDLAAGSETAEAIVTLPATRLGPVDSPELVRDDLSPGGHPTAVREWSVPILQYSPDRALAVLAGVDPTAVTLGATVQHLACLARFAADLVGRGRVLPTALTGGGSARAVWRPVLTGPDLHWARSLALALPPAARAADRPPRSAAVVCADALDSLVDATVRARLAPNGTAPGRTAPGRTTPGRTTPGRTTPGRTAPGRTTPGRTTPGRTTPGRTTPGGTTPGDLPGSTGAWLVALADPHGDFDAERRALTTLASELAAWQRDAAGGRVRACFRLVEPGEPGEPAEHAEHAAPAKRARSTTSAGPGEPAGDWRVEFALQAADEPSLLVDAGRVWRSRGALRAFARHLDAPQETLLGELGRASRLYPPLEDALRTARPSALGLDGPGAHRFLSEGAPLLAAAGFGVLLPGWWSRPRARLGVRLSARNRTAPGTVAGRSLGLDSIVDYEWRVSLGDEPLTAAELRTLTTLKTPLVRLRGQWVELDPKRLAAGLKLLTERGEMTVVDLLHAGLSTADGPGGLPVVAVTADGPLGDLLSGKVERHLAKVPTPAGFHGTLRPYQQRGLAWLSFLESLGLGGVLADDMGLGKCVAAGTPVVVNGDSVPASEIWRRYAGPSRSDGLGEWAEPSQPLSTLALPDVGAPGRLVEARIHRLYRQYVTEPVRRVRLDTGAEVVLTRRHKLLTKAGWTNEFAIGDHLAVPAPEPTRPDVGFAQITELDEIDYAGWVYDFEVPGPHNFSAAGVLCHNTVQLLALARHDPPGTKPTLLICPMSLVGNWQREAEKFVPGLRVHVHHGAERPRGEAFEAAVGASDLVITTYSLAARDASDLSTVDWHRIVVDEAQAIKNAATRQAAAVRALPARHRIAMTGTPVENRLADLWSIMEFANPGLLGSATVFRAKFAEPVERRGDEMAAERLKRLTGPFILRRLKTDRSIISDLPEKLEMDVLCNLTAEQASLYQAVLEDMLARIEDSEGIERRGLVLATMTKLKQVCNHPAQLLKDGSRLAGRSGKLARLEEILDEVLAVGDKALLFTQYAEFGGMLRAHLSARFGREVAFLHGGVGKADRDAMVARFQQAGAGSPALFVLSLKAGGTGLTLTAANHVVHVDRWWNPAVEDQATDRAFRIGQRRSVQVRKFVCAGTVEEKVADMIRDKRGLAARIVGTGEQWLTELSTTELRNLFALEAGAVVE